MPLVLSLLMSDTTRFCTLGGTTLTDLRGKCPTSVGSRPAAVASRCDQLPSCSPADAGCNMVSPGSCRPGYSFPLSTGLEWRHGPSGSPADAFALPTSSDLAGPGTPFAGPPATRSQWRGPSGTSRRDQLSLRTGQEARDGDVQSTRPTAGDGSTRACSQE